MAEVVRAIAENHIVQDHASCPSGKPWALVAKSSGKVLGCHASRGDAVKQEQVIKANQCRPSCACTSDEVEAIVLSASATTAARTQDFMGRKFYVVPAVLVRSQVLRNNLGVSYLPADEISSEWADQWNGIPVLVGAHPSLRGQASSGRTPELWNERSVGWIFNARAEQDGDARRLLGEVWLDSARVDTVPGFKDVMAAVQAGKPVELSTGFATTVERKGGRMGDEAYELIMRPSSPDHLVISTEMTGACSIDDGCGLGRNSNPEAKMDQKGGKGFSAVLQRVADLFERKPKTLTPEERNALRIVREVEALNEELTDAQRSMALQSALQAKFGTNEAQVIICDTYGDTKQAVFWYSTPTGGFPGGSEYFRTTWTENADGTYTFSDPERVKKVMSYEPSSASMPAGYSSQEKVQTADHAEVAAATNAAQPKTGEEIIMADEKDGLKALQELVANLAKTVTDLSTQVTSLATQSAPAEIAGLKRTIASLSGKFDSMAETMQAAVEERERERQSLVQSLTGNYKVPFTAAELEAKPVEELRKLADMAKGENYTGRGGPRNVQNHEQRFAEPTPYWQKPAAGKKEE